MTLDRATLRRLTYIKGLFHLADEHSQRRTEVDIAQAILTFDSCIEMILRLLSDRYGFFKGKSEIYFLTMLYAIKGKIDKEYSNPDWFSYIALLELHRARNEVQHSGITPSYEVVERSKEIVDMTLRNVVREIYEDDWDSISRALLIKDINVRQLYQKGEKAYYKGNYIEAIYSLIAAFELAKLLEQTRIWGSGIKVAKILRDSKKTDIQTHLTEVYHYIDQIVDEIEILKLRLDYKGYQKYREISSGRIGPNESPVYGAFNIEKIDLDSIFNAVKTRLKEIIEKRDLNDLRNWIVFALDFIIDAILRWEILARKGVLEFAEDFKKSLSEFLGKLELRDKG